EMAAFAQFGSDLDASTQRMLNRGARLTELLKQPQFSPMTVDEQVTSIFAGTRGYLDDIPVSQVGRFEEELLRFMKDKHGGVMDTIRESGELDEKSEEKLKKALDTFSKAFAA
ncbi:MAG: F0F1 ATP synthase subunit alpha, partial [Alphaproteobacteria bacterium]